MAKEKKFKSKTVAKYRKWDIGSKALSVGTVITPLLPATIITGINWDEWFNKCGTSLPLGLVSLAITVVIAIIGILKSDTVFKKKDVTLFYISFIILFLGITCLFWASLFTTLGWMFIYTGLGIGCSAVEYVGNQKLVQPQKAFYKELVEKNELDRKSKRKAEKIRRAEEERKEAEAEREKVDLL